MTVELLLVTARWPLTATHEFLDEEIPRLSEVFDHIVVAPMRPDGPLKTMLPPGVRVDRSLAAHLETSTLTRGWRSRRLTAASRALRPNPAGLGVTALDVRHDGFKGRWVREALLRRADTSSVAAWAARRTRRPDLAYTFWLGSATVGLRAAFPDVPVVSRVHGGDLFPAQSGWQSIPFQGAAVRSVDLLASVSESGRDSLVRRFPASSQYVTVNRLGTRDIGAQPEPPSARPLRLLSASSIDPNKRVDLIAQVVQLLAQQGKRVEWTHLGSGPGLSELMARVADLAPSATANLKGQVSLDEVHRELRFGGHHVFVNLSLSEGAPMSLMEAQCVGIPVVATRVGGIPEVVARQWNEIVDPRDSTRSIASAVLRAAARPAHERARRRAHWATFYSASVNYSEWALELERLAVAGRE